MTTGSPVERLSPKQRETLAALVSGLSVSDTAKKVGVHRTTIHAWTREHPIFQAALNEEHAKHAEMIRDDIRSCAQQALESIHGIMTDPVARQPRFVSRAAAFVLNIAMADQRATTEEEYSRLIDELRQEIPPAETENPKTNPGTEIARNAPCPCGSREKYKRCCGRNAPGILGPPTARAA